MIQEKDPGKNPALAEALSLARQAAQAAQRHGVTAQEHEDEIGQLNPMPTGPFPADSAGGAGQGREIGISRC